ncbi:transposable element Tc1 transposase [Trichonephila clavipes]|nr:transposable element Tc1 transposase [Trichonephila clavipes]
MTKVTSAREDRHLLRMAVNDRIASSRKLTARWSTATGVLMSASSIRRYDSRFNLWDHDGRIRVRRYADERCLPECVIERHSGLTPGFMVLGAISYHGRSNLLRIEGIPGAIFQQDNALPHVAKTVRDFCSAQHMQPLPRPANSPDMLPIEHVWDLVGRRLARDPCPAASKDELWLRVQAIWNSFPQAHIQNMFDSMPRRIAALISLGLAIHQNDHQARRRFVEWAQNEIAVVPDFHKRILFSDEAHFWLNGYVNKQNCRIWSEANPQVYVETPLHPEKLTVWCALWAGGILLQKR